MSALVCGKKYANPLPFIPSPHPAPPYPPPQRQLPWANDIGLSGSCDLLGQWRGVAGAQHRNPFRSVPRPSPPPAQCRQNRLFQWRKRSLTLGRVR
jgi:hypothetical protein